MNEQLRSASAPLKIGLLLSLLTVVLGFAVGVMFAEFEEGVLDGFRADAELVIDTEYDGDSARVRSSVDGSKTYLLRGHIHANGLGLGTTLLITFLLVFIPTGKGRDYSALLLGLGGMGYSTYWLITAKIGPGMGGISQAKAITGWYAICTSGLYLLGLLGLIYLFVQTSFMKKADQ